MCHILLTRMRRIFILLISSFFFLTCKKEEEESVTPVELPFPEWVFHHWVWEDESTQLSAIELVDDYLARDIPVGAIIIDSPWETGYNTLEWDKSLFPDARAMINNFKSKNVRTLLWITGCVNNDVQPLYDSLLNANLFMKKNAANPALVEWWKGDGGLFDWYNPDLQAWWKKMMDPILDMGIDGWKCDGTDYYQLTAPYSPAKSGNVPRLEYSHAYYRFFYEYTREKLGNDRIIMSRPIDNYGFRGVSDDAVAFSPIDVTFAGWVGDQDATFKGLVDALDNLYYSAQYGYLIIGSDIGGYREDDTYPLSRSKELFIRWAQMGAFNPLMENGGGGEHRPWKFDEQTTDIYRKYVKMHYQLIPYLVEMSKKYMPQKKSLMRFLRRGDYAYYLGDDIFVSPILNKEGTVNVKFPSEGEWVYLFDQTKTFSAGTTWNTGFPIEAFPVFIRKGSELLSTLTP